MATLFKAVPELCFSEGHVLSLLRTSKTYGVSQSLQSAKYMSTGASSERDFLHRSVLPTDYFQKSLPRLPIPKLDDTCTRYIAALTPLLSPAELERTKKVVEEFRTGEGKALQESLIAKDKKNKHTNYVSDAWFDMYLKDRRPVLLTHNPFVAYADDPRKDYMDQLVRATNFIVSSLRFMKTMRANVLEPEVFHLNAEKSDNLRYRRVMKLLPTSIATYGSFLFKAFPLDMSQYGRLFNSTRIPRPGRDELFSDPSARHILVIRNGNFYVFDVLDANGNIRPAPEILAELNQILADKSPAAEYPLGFLTSENRDVWTQLREKVLAAGNGPTLSLIDSAVFALVLEDSQTEEPNEMSRLFLYGDGANRWFDKSFTLMVTKTGRTAINFEHSWGDGVAVLRYMIETYKDTTTNAQLAPGTKPASGTSSFRKLNVQLTDELKSAIADARTKFHASTSKLDVNYLQYQKFGKDYIKKKKLSPDSFMQLAFQMAFYKLSGGKTPATYESCSTAAFKHGRTETVRPATQATAKTCSLFHATGSKRPSADELRACLHECTAKHNQLTKEAAMGQGFDRHLFGLKHIAGEQGAALPALFSDPAYALINHNILSTSTLSNSTIIFGGFAPVVPDGFGIGYEAATDILGCNVTTFPPARNVHQFLECLEQSFDELHHVLDTTSAKTKN